MDFFTKSPVLVEKYEKIQKNLKAYEYIRNKYMHRY